MGVESHRRFMLLGGMLLVLTFVVGNYYEEGDPMYNVAYVTGACMIGAFVVSFYRFYFGRARPGG